MLKLRSVLLSVVSLLLGTLLGLGIGSVSAAWSEPTLPPPQGNIDAPLNTSAMSQSKAGGLFLGVNNPIAALYVGTSSVSIYGGPVGIGSLDPGVYRNVNTNINPALRGFGLDIAYSGALAEFPSTVVLGADSSGVPNRRTNDTPKGFWISMPPYNLGFPHYYIAALGGESSPVANVVKIGGGTGNLDAATRISFYVASSTSPALPADRTGAELVRMSTDRVRINGELQVVNGTQGAGKVLTSDANGLATWSAPPAEYMNFQEFLPGSTETWKVPPGITRIRVQAWGGGGHGGIGDGNNNSRAGAGGGGGGYVDAIIANAVLPGQVITVKVGNAGNGYWVDGVLGPRFGLGGTSSTVRNANFTIVAGEGEGGCSGGEDPNCWRGSGGGVAQASGAGYVASAVRVPGGNGALRSGDVGGNGGDSYAGEGGLGGIPPGSPGARYSTPGSIVGAGGGGGSSDGAGFSAGRPGGVGRVVIWW